MNVTKNRWGSEEVKFQQILSDLIDRSPYRTNRRPVWEAVGVSSAALSQYTLGKARPRLETLVAIADFFGVSLDYLVLGHEAPKSPDGENNATTRFVEWALSDVQDKMQDKMGRRTWITARVGRFLSDKIESAIDEASALPMGGAVTNDEVIALERMSNETLILALHLGYDVVDTGNGQEVGGRFARIVADNLLADPPRPYMFLISEDEEQILRRSVHAFYRLLREELAVPEKRLRHCEFRVTSDKVLVGCCFYRLDWNIVRHQEPAIALALEEYVSDEGWMGYAINENSETNSEILMEAQHVSSAMTKFKALWHEGSPL